MIFNSTNRSLPARRKKRRAKRNNQDSGSNSTANKSGNSVKSQYEFQEFKEQEKVVCLPDSDGMLETETDSSVFELSD